MTIKWKSDAREPLNECRFEKDAMYNLQAYKTK